MRAKGTATFNSRVQQISGHRPCPHFGLIPAMVASSLLVLTTGRQYCERFTAQLPVKILQCPIAFPQLTYYQLWHERSHASASGRWLRERIKSVAAALRKNP